jgi:FkbM family methyltransferase
VNVCGWNWAKFQGSPEGLKWNKRDVRLLDGLIALCPATRVAVQAGGCLGIFPKRLAQSYTTVYTFEPSPALFPKMVQNAQEPNIIRFQAALGEHSSFVSVSQTRRDDKPCAHEGITHVSGSGVIPMLRLDDLKLATCDLLMFDLEGGELDALRGAQETLRRCRPVMAIEINKNLQFVGVTEAQIMGFIQDRGYRHVSDAGSDRVFVPVEWT